MITLTTFADSNMQRSMQLCKTSAYKNGIDNVMTWGPENISDEFYNMNPVLKEKRGVGYWLWKSYFIYKTMLMLPEGSILIYSDAGQEFIAPVQPVIDAMQGNIMLFTNGWPHVEWCKWDVIHSIIPGHPAIQSKQHPQCQASLQIYRVSQASKDFVKEWLLYCQMPGFIDDSPSKRTNYPTFAEHRHDQAILTTIAIKYAIPLRWFPTVTNMHQTKPGDNYPAIIKHFRRLEGEKE